MINRILMIGHVIVLILGLVSMGLGIFTQDIIALVLGAVMVLHSDNNMSYIVLKNLIKKNNKK